jgi:hypothetical protein
LQRPTPPLPREHRATRKPVLYRYLERWNEPELGLDRFEWEHLEGLGYGGWLERRRLTDRMTVDLLLYALDELRYFAAERPIHRADLRARMIELLQRRRIRSARKGHPSGLTEEEQALGHALVQLETVVNEHGGPLFVVSEDGTVTPGPEPEKVTKAWNAIRKRWPELTRELVAEVTLHETSDRVLRLGEGRSRLVIHLGERARYAAQAAALEAELGPKFLNPASSPRYRAACVRKWKQLALQRARR